MGSLGLFSLVLMIHYYSGKAIDPQPRHQMGESYLKCNYDTINLEQPDFVMMSVATFISVNVYLYQIYGP